MKELLVIGVGNWYRGDDAAGLVAARTIKDKKLPGVSVREESGEGTALMDAWSGAANVVVIDAVFSGLPPGTVHCLDAGTHDLPASLFRSTSHTFGVAEAVALARTLHRLPPKLTVYGIEGENFSPGVGLTRAVDSGAQEIALRIAAASRSRVATH